MLVVPTASKISTESAFERHTTTHHRPLAQPFSCSSCSDVLCKLLPVPPSPISSITIKEVSRLWRDSALIEECCSKASRCAAYEYRKWFKLVTILLLLVNETNLTQQSLSPVVSTPTPPPDVPLLLCCIICNWFWSPNHNIMSNWARLLKLRPTIIPLVEICKSPFSASTWTFQMHM